MNAKKSLIALAASTATLAGLAAPAAAISGSESGPGSEATYTVTFENLTGGQWLTPPNFAAHDKSVRVFRVGQPASAGVQQVAENGGVPALAAELADAVDASGHGVSGVGADAPIPPGESISFTVTTGEASLSIVSMLVCTNDGFAGLDAKALPQHVGQSRNYDLRAYDAGTEINTELRADLVPAPFCGEGAGSTQSNPLLAENGRIRPHAGIRGIGDLAASFGWCGPVARVTVTRGS